jgi:hypothetical protein
LDFSVTGDVLAVKLMGVVSRIDLGSGQHAE